MTSTRLKIFAMTALLAIAATALGDSTADQTLKQISGYREWTRLTKKPIVVAAASVDPGSVSVVSSGLSIDASAISGGG
jgi:hypothetical protein